MKTDKNLYYKNKYRIPSARLKGWDYSSWGWYFITICTKDRSHKFGEIIEGEMYYTELGHFAASSWLAMHRIFDVLIPDVWVIMPNHIHLLFGLSPKNTEYHENKFDGLIKNSAASIINHFKGRVTKYAKKESVEFQWQERFYDHIVRNQKDFDTIQNYIISNPQNWNKDKFFTE